MEWKRVIGRFFNVVLFGSSQIIRADELENKELGLESHEHIHYAMPLRIMGYDYTTYKKQYVECV